jgi:hypothetical protein
MAHARPKTPKDVGPCASSRAASTGDARWSRTFPSATWDVESGSYGCRERIVSGLDRVFSLVDRAIILEDDCLPHPDFFPYCDELLERFQSADPVMEIGGANYQAESRQTGDGFYFSRYAHTNGWATWRRAWSAFDAEIGAWSELRGSGFLRSRLGFFEALYWSEIFDRVSARDIVTSWDYQWQLAMFLNGGLSAVPRANLISNIGYGPGGTHTSNPRDPLACLPVRPLVSIGETPTVEADALADALEFRRLHGGPVKAVLKALQGGARRAFRRASN